MSREERLTAMTAKHPVHRPIVPPPIPGYPSSGRVPVQRRSRERLERILNEAAALIMADGSDALRMSDVAERAGISIGSLYQYFPDKAAILATLAGRYEAVGRQWVGVALATVRTPSDLPRVLVSIMREYYAQFLREPVMRDIWFGTQVDKRLLDLAAAENRVMGEMLERVLVDHFPDVRREDLSAAALLTMELIAATVRLAVTLDRAEGDHLIATFARALGRDLITTLARGDAQ